jgi:hypothetical protein
MKKALFISSYIIVILFFIFPAIALAAGSATISWLPNDEADLKGYRVYYGTSEGGPYGSSTALILEPATSHPISGLTEGETYYFVVVAVDTSDNESTWSDEVSKTIGAISPATDVTLQPNVASPQTQGTTITFTAQANGGSGSYQYQFWRQDPSGKWTMVQDYLSNNSYLFNTSDDGSVGTNNIHVRARSAGSPNNFDVHTIVAYVIE